LGKLRGEHLDLSKNGKKDWAYHLIDFYSAMILVPVICQENTIAALNSQLQNTSQLCSSLTAKRDSLEQEMHSRMKELDETVAEKETCKSDLRRAMVELKTSVAKTIELKR
jgi:uncharacterized coiled-coil protein SlyX